MLQGSSESGLILDSLFIVAPIVWGEGGGVVFGPSFLMQYFVSFLVLQSSH